MLNRKNQGTLLVTSVDWRKVSDNQEERLKKFQLLSTPIFGSKTNFGYGILKIELN